MKSSKLQIYVIWVGMFFILTSTSCTHDPVLPEAYTTNDPIFTGDCNPDTIYYETDVAPILNANCATSNCHDATTAKDGIDLSSYTQVLKTGEIVPFDAVGSEMIEVMKDNGKDQMPPLPANNLPQSVIEIMEKWINQGAYNYSCDEVGGVCDSVNMSFSTDINPVLASNCVGCHSGNTPADGIDLSNYSNVKIQVDNGKLMGSIAHETGFLPMPKDVAKLDNCSIAKLNGWITIGAPNN